MSQPIKALSLKKVSKETSIKALSIKQSKVAMVNLTAEHLARKFNDQRFIPFFRKCAWHLSEDQIWTIYERSCGPKIKQPLAYFIKVAKDEMAG